MRMESLAKVCVDKMEEKCPKCNINIKNEEFKSIKIRYRSVLIVKKERRKNAGIYKEIEEEKDCDLCGATKEDLLLQTKLRIIESYEDNKNENKR